MLRSARRIKELEEQLRQCRSQKTRCDSRLRDAVAQLNRTRSLRDGVSALHRAVSRRAQPQQVDTLRKLVGNHRQQIKVYEQLREGVSRDTDHGKQLLERFDAVIKRRRAMLAQASKPTDRRRLEVEVAATEAQRDVLMIQIASGRDELGVVKGAYGVLIDDLKAARAKPGCPEEEKRALTAAIDRLTAELARVTTTLARETQRLDVLSGMVVELEGLLKGAAGGDRARLGALLSEINDYRFDDGDADTVVGGGLSPAWKRSALQAVPVLLAGAGIYSFRDRLAQLFGGDRGALAAARRKIAELEAELANLAAEPSVGDPPKQGAPTASQVTALQAQINRLEAEKTASAEATQQIADLKAQLAAANSTAEEERAKAQEAYRRGQLPEGTRYVRAAAEERGLQSELQRTQAELDAAREQLAKIGPEETLARDKAALAAVSRELQTLRQAADADKGAITALQAQVDNAAAEAKSAAEEIATLTRNAEDDAQRYSKLEATKDSLLNRVVKLRETVAVAETSERAAKEELENQVAKIDKLKAQEMILRTELNAATEKVKKSEADFDQSTKEFETEMQLKEASIAKLKSKLGQFEQNSEELLTHLEALIGLSQTSHANMMQKLNQASQEGTGSGSANSSAYTKIADLLQSQQQLYDRQIEEIDKQLKQTQTELAACQVEKKKLMSEHATAQATPGQEGASLLSALFQ